MDIVGIDNVIFGVDDLEAARKFCMDYGLKETERGVSGASFEARDRSGVTLRPSSDKSLPSANVSGPTSRETIWGVRDSSALERIGAELSKDREVTRDAAGVLRARDDDGMAIAFEITKRQPFEAIPAQHNRDGLPTYRPTNRRVKFIESPAALTLGHIVYWTQNAGQCIKFYTERLGFRITDAVKNDGGAFMRAQGSSDHHSMFVIGQTETPASFQHLEFHFDDVQKVLCAGLGLVARGWQSEFGGFGRHVVGSNWYWYFKTPMGGLFEVAADIDQADDNWVPGIWNSLDDLLAAAIRFGDFGPAKLPQWMQDLYRTY